MRRIFIAIGFTATILVFQFCSSSRKAVKEPALTYQNNILPTIQGSCAPCHIAGKGNKKPLDNYANASGYIDEIISRIQRNPTDKGFMPFKHPKLPDSTINLFIKWKNAGLAEK